MVMMVVMMWTIEGNDENDNDYDDDEVVHVVISDHEDNDGVRANVVNVMILRMIMNMMMTGQPRLCT